jgi:hypothetical protein
MKQTLTAPPSSRSAFQTSFDMIPFACLLSIASLLALAGGIATSVLFFGLLLLFSLLVLGCRHFSASQEQRVARLRAD